MNRKSIPVISVVLLIRLGITCDSAMFCTARHHIFRILRIARPFSGRQFVTTFGSAVVYLRRCLRNKFQGLKLSGHFVCGQLPTSGLHIFGGNFRICSIWPRVLARTGPDNSPCKNRHASCSNRGPEEFVRSRIVKAVTEVQRPRCQYVCGVKSETKALARRYYYHRTS